MLINPNLRTHFVSFLACSEFKIEFEIDYSTNKLALLPSQNEFCQVLFDILNETDFKNLSISLNKLNSIDFELFKEIKYEEKSKNNENSVKNNNVVNNSDKYNNVVNNSDKNDTVKNDTVVNDTVKNTVINDTDKYNNDKNNTIKNDNDKNNAVKNNNDKNIIHDSFKDLNLRNISIIDLKYFPSSIFNDPEKVAVLFLFSNKIIPNLFKKNQLAKYSKIQAIYQKHANLFLDQMAHFSRLKKVENKTGTFHKIALGMKNSSNHTESSDKKSENINISLKDNGIEKNEHSKNSTETIKDNKNTSTLVVTRFPPEPSGFLHLGHVKAILINHNLAKTHNGIMLLRFDDTNPLNESQFYVDSILYDLKAILDINPHKISYTSDYFETLIKYAKQLINSGLAYCDATAPEQMSKERFNGIKSSYRDSSVEENTKIFDEMILGKNKTYCLRAKIDYSNLNKALRDPVIYRHIDSSHFRTGDKFKIYPCYDFCCPIIDSLEGVTHAFRTNEYRDRNACYVWILRALNLKNLPTIKDFSKLAFENTVLSKRKLKALVENNILEWDDPRMPTLRGIVKKGLDVNVLKEYVSKQGMKQTNCIVSWDKIWAENKIYHEKRAQRYTAIDKNDVLVVEIQNYEDFLKDNKSITKESHLSKECSDVNCLISNQKHDTSNNMNTTNSVSRDYIMIPVNRRNLDLGHKKTSISRKILIPNEKYSLDEEITLMNLGNFVFKNNTLTFVKNGDFKKTKHKVQWIDQNNYISKKYCEFYDLFKKNEEYNEESKKDGIFYCEESIQKLNNKDVIQLERIGFFYNDNGILNLIPNTKQLRKKQ